MRVVEFTYHDYTELGLIITEYGMAYEVVTKDKNNFTRPNNPSRYWTISKKHCHAEFGRTGRIFKLLYV